MKPCPDTNCYDPQYLTNLIKPDIVQATVEGFWTLMFCGLCLVISILLIKLKDK